MKEPTIESNYVYRGKIINVSLHRISLPDGKESFREIVEHSGAVCIVATNKNNEVVLVRQYRKPIEKELWEIPAGKLLPDEDPAICAKRELIEETGLIISDLVYLTDFYTSPGFTNERMYVYLAVNCDIGEACPDEDEYLEIKYFSWDEIFEMINSGDISDGKTITAIMLADRYMSKKVNE